MTILQKHEIFEIEVLDVLKTRRLLTPLVFGGGTMLRLCYELPRYSAGLDFWFIKPVPEQEYFEKTRRVLQQTYEMTDAQMKFRTLLFESRSPNYAKRLKIEIRRQDRKWDFTDRIAFSKFSNKQVILRVLTLEQAMKNKIAAFLGRHEIRDAFDIEFLLRKGVALPELPKEQRKRLIEKLDQFKEKDFKVKLGSILEPDMRKFYIENRFAYLKEKLANGANSARQ